MRNFILTIIVFTCTYSFSFSQKLNNSNSFDKALELSVKKSKPVLLIVNVRNFTPTTTMQSVRVDFSSALDNKEVIEKINENFIVYRTILTDTSVRAILSKSAINTFPAFIFLHTNKDVFYKDFGNFRDKGRYLSMIDSALNASKEKSVSELEKDYLENKNNVVLLKKLIDERKKVGINNNAELIEQYVNSLKIGDFNDYKTVLYILEAGPYTNGNAYKLAYTNRKIIDSIYKTESLQKRVNFNNFMINNTMNDAIKKKNLSMAQSSANFTRGTWSNNYNSGTKAYESQMMKYYLGVKDTANYMLTAIYHYDNFYMRIGADSIKKIESKERDAAIKRNMPTMVAKSNIVSKEKIDSLMKVTGTQKISQSLVAVGSSSSNFALELNNAAWQFYQTGTKNINYLTKALIWSRRSIELNPIGSYYDTLAHILYRMSFFEEAIKTEEDAIEKSKSEGKNINSLLTELKKMKLRQI